MIPVIVPFYRDRRQMDTCMAHLNRQCMSVEVFVRDNTEDNIFFTAAVNEGIRRYLDSPAAYMVVLNQDMYLAPDAIERMVDFMNRNRRCGIAAPLQRHHEHPDYVIWAGSYEAFPAGRHEHGPIEGFRDDAPIAWANGACMILRKTMIREIGLLDENLVFIGSDSDYSFTARSRGWEVWRVASASGIHEHGASGKSGDPAIEARKLEDMIYFSRKWLSGGIYRSLSLEGARLTHDAVVAIEADMARARDRLRSQHTSTPAEGAQRHGETPWDT